MKKIFRLSLVLISLFFTFTTHAEEKIWRVALISDMNGSYGSKTYAASVSAAIQHIRSQNVNLVMSTGDMVAGQMSGLDYLGMWNAFHNVVSRPLNQSSIPLLPSPGNHDAAAGFTNERNHYRNTWNEFPLERFNSIRANDDKIQFVQNVVQNFPFNYAVTMGPAVLISLDATAVGGLINGQLDWLEDVLKKTSSYKVKMVFGHVPLYPFAFGRAHEFLARGTGTSFYQRLESMLETYKVNLFISGHHHAFFPGHRGLFTRYISTPLLGSGARPVLTKNRSQKVAPQGFLYLTFNAVGAIEMQALKSPNYEQISLTSLPPAVSVPTSDASDCVGCAGFPAAYFANKAERILYWRW